MAAEPGDVSDRDVEEIVVTGSRIARTNVTSSTPVQIQTAEELETAALSNLASVLFELPQFGRSELSSVAGTWDYFNSGVNTVNLRNLGAGRTLVLIDGRRAVSGVAGTSAVDFNTIPINFVERVEVVTDGASAVYGSDAIAGVVNIITKDNFEGVSVTARGSFTDAGGGEKQSISATFGGNFADDTGNAVLSINYYDDRGLMASERGFSAEDQFLDAIGSDAYSTFPNQGRFLTNLSSFDDHFTFDSEGNLVQGFDRAVHGYNRAAYRTISSPNERILVAAKSHKDLSERVTLFGDISFAQVDTSVLQEPRAFTSANVALGPAGGMPLDNPFIPQGLLDFINDRNTNPDPGDDIESVQYARRLGEVGVRTWDNSRQTLRTAIGLEGDLFDDWSWDAWYSFGQTLQSQTGEGQINSTNIIFALDVEEHPELPGQYRCVNELARERGCVPLNLFGVGSVTQEAADYIEAPSSYQATIQQSIAAANLRGPLFEMPAGTANVALGVEQRRESSKEVPDVLTQTGQTTGAPRPASSGSFDVQEAYVELDIPLLDGMPFARYLGVTGAIRFADYSTVGSTFSWKMGATWQPIKDIRFRGTYGTSVRAPNISELYTSGAPSLGSSLLDPCSGVGGPDFVDETGGILTANCLAEPGVAQRVSEDGAFIQGDLNRQFVSVSSTGNPELQEEEADTLTVGFIVTPSFLPDFDLTVDYYRIEIDQAIQNLSDATLMQLCYSQSEGVRDEFCSTIERFPSNPDGNAEFHTGQIRLIEQTALNVGGLNTSGVDVSANYRFDLESAFGVPGSISLGLTYTRLIELEQLTKLPDGMSIDVLHGEVGASENRWNGSVQYQTGALQATYAVRTIGEALDNSDLPADAPFNYAGRESYHDLHLRYEIDDELYVTAAVNNLTDNEPPYLPAGTRSAGTSCNRPCAVYDPYGRTFQLGVTKEF